MSFPIFDLEQEVGRIWSKKLVEIIHIVSMYEKMERNARIKQH